MLSAAAASGARASTDEPMIDRDVNEDAGKSRTDYQVKM